MAIRLIGYTISSHIEPSLSDSSMIRLNNVVCTSEDLYSLCTLVQSMGNQDPSWTIDESLDSWRGVTLYGQFEYECPTVESIDWSHRKLTGTVDLRALPENITKVLLNNNFLAGSLDLTILPTKLCHLDVSNNSLSGFIEIMTFPPNLHFLNIRNNPLRGRVNAHCNLDNVVFEYDDAFV